MQVSWEPVLWICYGRELKATLELQISAHLYPTLGLVNKQSQNVSNVLNLFIETCHMIENKFIWAPVSGFQAASKHIT